MDESTEQELVSKKYGTKEYFAALSSYLYEKACLSHNLISDNEYKFVFLSAIETMVQAAVDYNTNVVEIKKEAANYLDSSQYEKHSYKILGLNGDFVKKLLIGLD